MASTREIAALGAVALLVLALFALLGRGTTGPEVASTCPTSLQQFGVSEGANGALSCVLALSVDASCKLVAQTVTVNCATFTTPSGATTTYAVPCYVTATGVGVNHATCQLTYTEANTNAAITITLLTAINTNTVYTAQDVIWVAPSTVITVSLQVTSGTFNIAGNIIQET